MNRAVIFNSFFFHKTLPNRFKAGHANRRINLTFLFGSHVKGYARDVSKDPWRTTLHERPGPHDLACTCEVAVQV